MMLILANSNKRTDKRFHSNEEFFPKKSSALYRCCQLNEGVIARLICYEINRESISINVCLCYEFLYIVKWIIKASFAGCEGFFS